MINAAFSGKLRAQIIIQTDPAFGSVMILPSLSTVIAILIIYGVLFSLAHRVWTALAMTTYVVCFVLLLSVVKQSYLGVAATLADVVFFLMHPKENFHLFVHYPMLGVLLLTLLLGFASCLIVGLKLEKPIHQRIRPPHRHSIRIAVAAISVALSAGAVWATSSASRTQVTEGDVFDAFESMYQLQNVSGIVYRLNLFFNNRSMEPTLPAAREQQRFKLSNLATTNNPSVIRPDIFMILEESTFDSTLIANCDPAQCDNAMLHPLSFSTRTQQGPLLVHSTGGGTWLSEFAFMSGFDWRLFGRGGAYAPVSIAPRLQEPLPEHLRRLGYRTVAVCPTGGNFLSAQTAYQHYGFDEFYSADDLKLESDWTELYDHTMFEHALKLSQRDGDTRPVFVFVLTIRNHGPHGEGAIELSEEFQRVQAKHGPYLADYLSRMRDSSEDFTQAAKQWLSSTRPRVIGWFGDHQPEAAWDVTQHHELLQRDRVPTNITEQQIEYITQYQLSANFGDQLHDAAHEAIDISYLGSQLIAFAGLPPTAGEHVARDVAIQCNGMMITCKDRELINDYLSYRIHELKEIH